VSDLEEVGAKRIEDMDASGIGLTVLSLATTGRMLERRLKKSVKEYLRENFWITTSAFFHDELLTLALATFGEDRVMFSVDFPFSRNEDAAT
jgi:predicted TIM-barrel fold metal-dependent hydrolase